MMRHRLILAALVSLGMVGCMLKPAPFVEPTGRAPSIESPATAAAPETTDAAQVGVVPASEYGTLTLSVRWPQQTGYQTALLPTSTNTLGIWVKQGTSTLKREVLTRVPGQPTATASLKLQAANNLSVEVKAYREFEPNLDTAVPIAQKSGTFNITRSKNTAANLTLDPLNVPTVDGMSTNYGVTGDTVVLTGTNFGSGTVPTPLVAFNGVRAVSVTRNSETQLTVTVPPSAVTGKVVVTADGVDSTSEAIFWVPQTLMINSTGENWEPWGLDYRLVMFGKTRKFVAFATWTIKIGDPMAYGTPPSPTWTLSNPSAGSIDGNGLFTAARSYQQTNVSASLGSLQSNPEPVRLVADAPVITGLSPNNGGMSSSMAGGPKTVVAINGSGFGDSENSTLKVFLGTSEIQDFTRVSDNQITFVLPSSGMSTGQVKVVSYTVTSTNKPTFQVLQSLSISPWGGNIDLPLGGTQQFTISGTDTTGAPVASPSVTWASSATSSATVSQTGLLTAVGYGMASPIAQSGMLQTWGVSVKIDYAYNLGSGASAQSNSVSGVASPLYYAQLFTLAQARTFKALDSGVAMDGGVPLGLEFRTDVGGLPSSGAIASRTATLHSTLPGHVYVFDTPITLNPGSYHLIYKVPANTNHYLYYLTSGDTVTGLQSTTGAVWAPITTVPPNNPMSVFFRLGE